MRVWMHCLDNEKMESKFKGEIIGVKVQMQLFDLYFGLNHFSPVSHFYTP